MTNAECRMTKQVRARNFDLAKTLESGQVFHWHRSGDGFVGAIGDRAAFVEQRADSLITNVDAEVVRNYFALDHPLAEICASFPNDPVMNAARDFCRGLRIIRQPRWECLATFICSSMKQVAHISQISLALRKRFGEERKIGDRLVYTFPLARRLARASEKELRECKLGYRAKNLRATARLVSCGHANLEAWS